MKSQPTNHEVNLVAVHAVHSMLVRLGAKPKITREGTRTGFAITHPSGRRITVSVRAKTSPNCWFTDAPGKITNPKDHFVVFLDYNRKWEDAYRQPNVWIVPDERVEKLRQTGESSGMTYVTYRSIASLERYVDAWHLLIGESELQGDWCGTGELAGAEKGNAHA